MIVVSKTNSHTMSVSCRSLAETTSEATRSVSAASALPETDISCAPYLQPQLRHRRIHKQNLVDPDQSGAISFINNLRAIHRVKHSDRLDFDPNKNCNKDAAPRCSYFIHVKYSTDKSSAVIVCGGKNSCLWFLKLRSNSNSCVGQLLQFHTTVSKEFKHKHKQTATMYNHS